MSEGIVYAIYCKDMVKIGFTTGKLSSRLKAIQANSPVMFDWVYYLESNQARETETAIHRMFEGSRSHYEWFNHTRDMNKYIKSIMNKYAHNRRVYIKRGTYSIDYIKEILGVGSKKYKLYGHFKRRILSQYELNYSEIKNNKKVTHLVIM